MRFVRFLWDLCFYYAVSYEQDLVFRDANWLGLNGDPPRPASIKGGFGSGLIRFGAGMGFGCGHLDPFVFKYYSANNLT